MNEKGLYVLKKFIDRFGPMHLGYVVSAKDERIENDFYDEIKLLCDRNNIRFYEKDAFNIDIEKEFSGFKFAIGWRWIIENTKKLIVLHDSILPRYRGFAPLVNILINKEPELGVTALFANSSYDEGDIIAQKKIKVSYPIKIKDAISQIQPLYFELISFVYELIISDKEIPSLKQNHSDASYSLWRDDDDYFIDWRWSAEKISRFVDSVGAPFGGAKTYLNGDLVKIDTIEIFKNESIENRLDNLSKVIFFDDGDPVVVCFDGLVVIRKFNEEKIKIKFRSRFL